MLLDVPGVVVLVCEPVVDWFCAPTAVEPEFVELSGVVVVVDVVSGEVVVCEGVVWPEVLDVLLWPDVVPVCANAMPNANVSTTVKISKRVFMRIGFSRVKFLVLRMSDGAAPSPDVPREWLASFDGKKSRAATGQGRGKPRPWLTIRT